MYLVYMVGIPGDLNTRLNGAGFMVGETFFSQGTGGATRMDPTVSTFRGHINMMNKFLP